MISVPADVLKGAAGRRRQREDQRRQTRRPGLVFSWQLRTQSRLNTPNQRQARTGTLKVCTCKRARSQWKADFILFHLVVDTPYLNKHSYLVPARPPPFFSLHRPPFSHLKACRLKFLSPLAHQKNQKFQSKVLQEKLKFESSNFSEEPILTLFVLCQGRGRCSAKSCFFLP